MPDLFSFTPGDSAIVAARYSTNAGQTITTGGSPQIVNFEDLGFDTHSAVTTGAAWKFTAPVTGIYHVSVMIMFTSTTAWAENERGEAYLFMDGAQVCYLGSVGHAGSTSQYKAVVGSTLISLVATHYIDIRAFQMTGGDLALFNDDDANHISIFKL